LYSPLSSVVVVRTFSIRAGLDASTVTPGSTAPELSLAVPAMAPVLVPCARERAGCSNTLRLMTIMPKRIRLIERSPCQMVDARQLLAARRDRSPPAFVINCHRALQACGAFGFPYNPASFPGGPVAATSSRLRSRRSRQYGGAAAALLAVLCTGACSSRA